MDSVKTYLDRFEIEPRSGNAQETILAVQQRLGLAFPEALTDFYAYCDGVPLLDGCFEVLSLDKAAEMCEAQRKFGVPSVWGYLPFTDANNSNDDCVCCQSPLRGMIVRVYHDNAPRLIFSSIDRYFDALAKVPDAESLDLEGIPVEFPNSGTVPEFSLIADQLVALSNSDVDDLTREQAQRFAVNLYGVDDLQKIGELLAVVNEDLLRDVRDRLSQISNEEAQDILQTHRRAFETTIREACLWLTDHGVAATYAGGDAVLIGPNKTYCRADWIYARRNDKTVDPLNALVQQFKQSETRDADEAPGFWARSIDRLRK